MKNARGISIITLIITIIVMIILASIVYIVGNDGMETADSAKYYNEKKSLQEAMQARFSGYVVNKNANPLEGTVLDEWSADSIIAHLKSIDRKEAETTENREEIIKFVDGNVNHAEYTRIINYYDMLALEIANVSHKTNYSYIVNYHSLDIIGPIK